MDARQRWMDARKDAEEGRYEEALNGYIWFFKNSLAESRAHAGTRLSYLLGDWIDLGKRYPEAHFALTSMRDELAESLRQGRSDKNVFHDIEAINDRLGRLDLTYQLYLALEQTHPELAASCARHALPSMIAAGDFARAAATMGDLKQRTVQACERLNDDVRRDNRRRYTRAPIRWANIRIFCDHLQRTLSVAEGCGDLAEAARLKALAFTLIQDPTVRRDVDDMLRNPHRRAPLTETGKQAHRRSLRIQKDKKKMEMAELKRLGLELRHSERFA